MVYQEISIDKIDPNPFQTRRSYDPEVLEGLMKSATNNIGIRSAPLVRPHPTKQGRYQVASGHGRVQAWKTLGHKSMLCRVENLDDEQMMTEVLVENVHRQNLSHGEIYQALEQLRKRYGIDQAKPGWVADLAKKAEIKENFVTEHYEMQGIVARSRIQPSEEIKLGVVRSTRGLPEPERVKLVEKAAREDWGQRTTLEVKSALKDMQPEVRAKMLSEKTKLPPKVIVALQEIKEPEKQLQAVDYIKSHKLNEELALGLIERAKEGEVIAEVRVVDEAQALIDELEHIYETIAKWGVNQRAILGGRWKEALVLFSRIEKKIRELGMAKIVEGEEREGTAT